MKTKIIQILTLALIFSCMSSFITAQSYSGGSGTPGDPYLIGNKNDLKYLSENSGEWSKDFRQIANIVFEDSDFQDGGDFYNDGAGFIPIGNLTVYFTGRYNGDNYTIDGLQINRPVQNHVGFFGYIYSSSSYVWNLGLINTEITGANNVGCLVGSNLASTLTNSYATGVVNGAGTAGGLVGYSSVNAIISSCHADVVVNSTGNNSGGLVAYSYQSSISNCYATGTVNGTFINGGLIGYCYESYISKSFSTVNVSGINYIGGLIGYKYSGSVNDSYARGNIYRSSGSSNFLGGFIGYSDWGTVSKCYSTGTVSGDAWAPADKGFAGIISGSTFAYNYWDVQTSGQSSSAGQGTGQLEGKTTSEMKQQATFVTWDFVNTWRISSITNNGYPFHAWQCKNRKYITVSGAGSFSGDDWANALSGTQLQAAINDPCATEVWVAAGTYHPTVKVGGTTDRHKTFQMRNGVAIYGGFAGTETAISQRTNYSPGGVNETVLSGDLNNNDNYSTSPWQNIGENCYHVFYHPAGLNLNNTATLDGFTIKGGNAAGPDPHHIAGGMYNSGSSPKLNRVTFMNNTAYSAGAVYFYNSSPVFDNSIFRNNLAGDNGGAIYLQGSSSPVFTNCLITNNTAYNSGAGVLNVSSANPVFINATITANHAINHGGGIYNNGIAINIKNSIIWGNTANHSMYPGKQIFNYGGVTSMEYCCFSNGPGDTWQTSGAIMWDGNTIHSDPIFADASGGDYRIKGNSPCADAGNDAFNALTTDIRGAGFGRKLLKTNYLQSGPIDMGAYEYNSNTDPVGCIPPSVSCPGALVTDAAGGSCTAVVTYAVTATGIPEPTLSYVFSGATGGSGSGTGSGMDFYGGLTIVTVSAVNDCGSATCSFTVTVNDTQPPAITCPGPFSAGMNNGCYYTGAIGQATATDNCDLTVTDIWNDAPGSFSQGQTTVTWYARDAAGNIASCTQTVTVSSNVLSGTLKYNNAAQTPLNNVTVKLLETSATSITDDNGNYSFTGLCGGNYHLEIININKPVGYINSTDASQINAWAVNISQIERVKWMAGDVTFSGGINSTDAKAVQNYFVYFWPFVRGEWAFWKAGELVTAGDMNVEIPVSLSGNLELNLYGQAVGDFNGSFIPGSLKAASSTLGLAYGETRLAGASSEVELPVRILNSEIVSAASLILDYPAELFEVTDVEMKLEIGNLDWRAKGGELRAGWNSLQPLWFEAGSVLLTIHGRTTESFGEGDEIRISLAPDPLNELADGNYNVIPDAKLMTEVVAFSTTGIMDDGTWTMDDERLEFTSRPNPFAHFTTLVYNLPLEGPVTLEISDMLGRRVALLVDERQLAGKYSLKLDATPLHPGVYMATIKCGEMVKTIKLVRD